MLEILKKKKGGKNGKAMLSSKQLEGKKQIYVEFLLWIKLKLDALMGISFNSLEVGIRIPLVPALSVLASGFRPQLEWKPCEGRDLLSLTRGCFTVHDT